MKLIAIFVPLLLAGCTFGNLPYREFNFEKTDAAGNKVSGSLKSKLEDGPVEIHLNVNPTTGEIDGTWKSEAKFEAATALGTAQVMGQVVASQAAAQAAASAVAAYIAAHPVPLPPPPVVTPPTEPKPDEPKPDPTKPTEPAHPPK